MAKMNDQELAGVVGGLMDDCENYQNSYQRPARLKAQQYYDGNMVDTQADEGRSKAISKDVRSTIKKVLPSIKRVFFGSDKIVEYSPVAEGDEAGAEQATDYVNYVILPESGGEIAIQDAMHDALLKRNGILKWYVEKKKETLTTTHDGLDEMSAQLLVAAPDVEVIGGQIEPDNTYTVQIRREVDKKRIVLECVPLSEFFIHPDAKTIEDSPIVAHKSLKRRGELIAAGYKKSVIEALSAADGADIVAMDNEEDDDGRRGAIGTSAQGHHPSIDEIEITECFVRVDYDGDGIAELRRVIYAGDCAESHMLENEPWDDMIPFGDLVAEREPHQWEGRSIPDDIEEIQRIKTVLLRNTLDNIYWQNNLQPIVQSGAIQNPEAVTQAKFGQPIRVNDGVDVRAAVGYSQVPFVAAQSFQMLGYMDEVVTDRTGVSDAASGMAPDALQNTTAKASAMIEQGGIAQTDMTIRNLAQGLERVFKGILRLVIQHQDQPRTVRLRDKWVKFDPRSWDSSMDATVNTGLGAGTRERDMMALQFVMQMQEKLLASFGATDNPYVTPDNVWNALSRMVEASGLKTVSLYFTKPDPAKLQQIMEGMRNKPDPETVKHKNALELEQAKGQTAVTREQAQVEGARQMRELELRGETQLNEQKLELQRQSDQRKSDLERQRIEGEQAIERERIASEERIAMRKEFFDDQKAHAAEFMRQFGHMGGAMMQ